MPKYSAIPKTNTSMYSTAFYKGIYTVRILSNCNICFAKSENKHIIISYTGNKSLCRIFYKER